MGLVLANLFYFVWAQNFLSVIGLASHHDLEAERLDHQIEPDHIIVGIRKNNSANLAEKKASVASASITPASDNASSITGSSSSESIAATETLPLQEANKDNSRGSPTAQDATVASISNASTDDTKNNTSQENNSGVLGCQQSALLTSKQVALLRPLLQKKFPANSWKVSQLRLQTGWLVYMGKYPDKKEFAKKEQELKSRGVNYEIVKNPKLQPGFVLASFDTEEKANAAKKSLLRYGIRTAKVVEDETRPPNSLLVFPRLNKNLKPQLDELKAQLPGRWLGACDRNTVR